MKHDTKVTALVQKQTQTHPQTPLAAALMETLPRAQLATSFTSQVNRLAGPLAPRVRKVFGGSHAPIYLLTDPARRQVWNAVLAVRPPQGDIDSLRTDFLHKTSKALLRDAYGSLPRGFRTVLNKSGEIGLEKKFYIFWHSYMTLYPQDFRFVAARPRVEPDLVEIMTRVPEALGRLPVIAKVEDPEDLPKYVEAITWIHGGRPAPAVWDGIAARLMTGETPLNIVTKLVDAVQCPPPHIQGDSRFRHLNTLRAIKSASHEFENCLGEAFNLREAARGETQFYIYQDGGDRLIVAITSDHPYGFITNDIRAHKNKRPAREVRHRVEAALKDHGVTDRSSIYDTVCCWGSLFGGDIFA